MSPSTLQQRKYFPFRKANNTPLYINALANHPPTIIKQFPNMINKRISDLPCDKEEFDKVKSVYETAMKDSGHFSETETERFNPPYSQNVAKNNKYHKIFSLNTLKLSYCCTTNVGGIIKQRNSKVLSKINDKKNHKCNCISKPNCPLNSVCLTQSLV